MELPLTNVEGALTWQQYGDNYALLGSANGRLLGGRIEADVNSQQDSIDLRGDVNTAALFRLIDIPSEQARQVIEGSADWSGQIQLEPTPKVSLESRWLGVVSHLPEPFAKTAEQAWPWQLTIDLESGRLETHLSELIQARVQRLANDELAGELALGGVTLPQAWPHQPGFHVAAELPEIDPVAWYTALTPLMQSQSADINHQDSEAPISLRVHTPCLRYRSECFGALSASGDLHGQQVGLLLSGDLVSGRVEYSPGAERPLDIIISSLEAERLFEMPSKAHSSSAPAPGSWVEAVETQYATSLPIPS